MQVNVKRLRDSAKLPTYGSEYAAGADLYSIATITIKPHQTVLIPTGIAIELPTNTVGLIYARSGLACKQGLAPANKVGVIDSDYRGEIMIALHNHDCVERTVYAGDRIAQLIVAPYYTCTFEEVINLTDTNRGIGGFGSTGV